ncbi:hypothetical protein BDM02DRAFT_3170498 [Thelephora ganbajun]|uniref:Uncharacterized protein n=1 Tax=Thelephora ganbajun TaxID=370292 RepID=A0ACB6ZC34_THEGA|nr:hypothetical protein BDM02DRAFT_3170498 [Thelephora ganbajun]
MAGPFLPPQIVLDGFKERPEALAIQGDKLYIGTSTGTVQMYTLGDERDEAGNATLTKTITVSKKPIEQLGYLKDVNSLVVLSDMSVTLFPIPDLQPPSQLSKAKAAFSFTLHTSVQHVPPPGKSPAIPVPTVVSYLVVACRRKLVIYLWEDGEPQEVQEIPLPHSPRTMSFMNDDMIAFAYSLTEHAIFSLKTMTPVDITLPATTTTTGMGAFSGLTGYMTLGLGAKAKPSLLAVKESEVLIVKDNVGHFLNTDGSPSRPERIDWPAPPEETALIDPYVFAVLPPGTVPSEQTDGVTPSFIPSSVVQVRSSISFANVQTVPFPPLPAGAAPTASNYSIRLLTSSPSSKSPLYMIRSPIDRNAATAQGSTIWRVYMKSWGEQIDELVVAGSYLDARSLLDILDVAVVSDKVQRRALVRSLYGVSLFKNGKYDEAIDIFIELDINPSKVVSLYPESIAGRLSTPEEDWVVLFGGPKEEIPVLQEPKPSEGVTATEEPQKAEGGDQPDSTSTSTSTAPAPGATPSLRGYLPNLIRSSVKDDDTASVTSRRSIRRRVTVDIFETFGVSSVTNNSSAPSVTNTPTPAPAANAPIHPSPADFKRSIDALRRYLTDRRPKLDGVLKTFGITPSQSHKVSPLSEATVEDLRGIPSVPLTALTPDQLIRFAQVVYTALFKSYLLTMPGLLGSLCRIENWCEVSEVEALLTEREKFSELIFLYNGKKMHAQALGLLQHLSQNESDMREKLQPTVTYLQKLGEEYMDQVFKYARWVFQQDQNIAFEIFQSEDVELPRPKVADFLETIDPRICARFIEYLIEEKGEDSIAFHNRLAELYLKMATPGRSALPEASRSEAYTKLLTFIDTTETYQTDRLFGVLPSEGFFEAKAILLGRMGRHENALEIYVYRLHDYLKAEEYCNRIFDSSSPKNSSIFLTLLRIYLQPGVSSTAKSSASSTFSLPPAATLLQPALQLIGRHSRRLDATETLKLLPPLVQARDVKEFLVESLRVPRFDTRVIREITKARRDDVATRLMVLEERRVKVIESRICPQCHKRIGHNSVIAVHAPRGEVTHYQCREAFSRFLRESAR